MHLSKKGAKNEEKALAAIQSNSEEDATNVVSTGIQVSIAQMMVKSKTPNRE